MKRYLTIFVLLLILMSGSFFSLAAQTSESPENQNRIQGVGALGYVEPRSRVIKVSHDAGPNGARIEELLVKEMDSVKEGDTLAVLSDYGLKEARVRAAEADIAVLEARLETEQVNAKYTKRDYDRQKELVDRSVVSLSQLDQSEQSWKTSLATIKSLKQEIKQAEANLEVEKKELDKSIIRAPISGTILSVLSRSGERITDDGVVEMADLTSMDIVAEVYESDIPDISLGQKAEISFPGQPQKFTGELYELGYIVRGNDLNDTDPLSDQDNRVVEVRIAMPEESISFLENQIYRKVFVRVMK